jgi:hypothetical protein
MSEGPLKWGTVRGDGYIFNGYKADGREHWYSPSSFHRQRLNLTLSRARDRAHKSNVPFDIDADYLASIFPPDGACPVLGFALEWGDKNGRDNSPSLDRIVPELGYVRGNVQWLSNLANTIKSSATPDQIIAVGVFMKVKQSELRRDQSAVSCATEAS